MSALDQEKPASQSQYVLKSFLREEFGFDGVICSDCICMDALKGPLPQRAALTQEAGCDVVIAVHGNLGEQAAILDALKPISDVSLERLAKANQQVPKAVATPQVSECLAEYQVLRQLMVEAGFELEAPPIVGTV